MPIQFSHRLLCDSHEIRSLSEAEFSTIVTARRGYEFKWADGIIRDGAETPVHTEGYSPEIIDKLVVCDMGAELGLGLFAKERIPKGTAVLCYTGVESSEPEPGDLYAITANRRQFISARHRGNLAGFIQHIGPFSTYKHYVDEMTVDNLSLQANPDGTLWLIAKRDILPNEILGYPYDISLDSYWSKVGALPKHFDRYGRVLPYDGAIFATNIINTLIYMATCLKDTEQLRKLEEAHKACVDFALLKLKSTKPSDALINIIFFSHIDLLRSIYPTDREALFKLLAKLKLIFEPKDFASTSPYQEKRVVNYVNWIDFGPKPAFFPPSVRCAVLSFPDGFFKINNPFRYYVYQPQPKSELNHLNIYAKDLIENGLKDYKLGKYAAAAYKWEHALRILRDVLTTTNMASDSAAPLPFVSIPRLNVTGLRDDIKDWNISYNTHILDLSWNLGNAYLKASEVEAPIYKGAYLREAELCIQIAVKIAEASDEHAEKLAKYQTRLDIIIALGREHAEPASSSASASRSALG